MCSPPPPSISLPALPIIINPTELAATSPPPPVLELLTKAHPVIIIQTVHLLAKLPQHVGRDAVHVRRRRSPRILWVKLRGRRLQCHFCRVTRWGLSSASARSNSRPSRERAGGEESLNSSPYRQQGCLSLQSSQQDPFCFPQRGQPSPEFSVAETAGLSRQSADSFLPSSSPFPDVSVHT